MHAVQAYSLKIVSGLAKCGAVIVLLSRVTASAFNGEITTPRRRSMEYLPCRTVQLSFKLKMSDARVVVVLFQDEVSCATVRDIHFLDFIITTSQ